jgi:hypothetical protein
MATLTVTLAGSDVETLLFLDKVEEVAVHITFTSLCQNFVRKKFCTLSPHFPTSICCFSPSTSSIEDFATIFRTSGTSGTFVGNFRNFF